MIRDILRFNRIAPEIGPDDARTTDEFLADEHFGEPFRRDYLLPMAAAIWSTGTESIGDFPIRGLTQFFVNHGLLSLRNRPQWYVVRGGSRTYVDRILSQLENVRTSAPVLAVRREADAVEVETKSDTLRFDEVVIATHSDQALAMLADPSPAEQEVLGAIAYQPNTAVLHTDRRQMPETMKSWASWNYRIADRAEASRATLTYNMNILQHHDTRDPLLVTLNPGEDIDPASVLKVRHYHHPVYNHATFAAQRRHADISGVDRIHYAGAYWRYGFHEDGVMSALAVCQRFGLSL